MMNDAEMVRAVTEGATFLTEHQVRTLPVDPLALACECGWRVKLYSQTADKMELSLGEVVEAYGTEDAFTSFRRRPVIFYNDTIRSRERVLFSLCHEIGHIVLDHESRRINGVMTESLRRRLDREAHAFASSMMAPAPVAKELALSMQDQARRLFGLSRAAWNVRMATLERDIAWLGEERCAGLTEHFAPWMRSLRCKRCGAVHAGGRCPVCGRIRAVSVPKGAERHAMQGIVIRPERAPRKGVPMLEAELDNPML